jgi:hypothetical protein
MKQAIQLQWYKKEVTIGLELILEAPTDFKTKFSYFK